MILAVCYVLYLGIEVVARSAEVFIIILLLLGVAGNFLVLFSGYVDFHQLQPFLEDGWKPVFTTAFPRLLSFPFGEMIVFTMLYPYLNRPEAVKKVWLSAIISRRAYFKLYYRFEYCCTWCKKCGEIYVSFAINNWNGQLVRFYPTARCHCSFHLTAYRVF
ncbi:MULTISPECIES: spore germination protein [Bacillus]|uniref:spore germination protein n=1 Tax=Bacillus TaxID=1386 RepID=UPI000AADDFC3|nr:MULTISPECIES: spore germination protein [Bacillus]MED1097650.1 spore germination protein [Bacillus capparidis]